MVINLQFKHSVPTAPLPRLIVVIYSALTAILTTSVVYALSMLIGFPLPFGIITVSPAWVTFMLLPLASFLRKARGDPHVWLQIVNTLKTWICQESLVVIYPTYFYIYATLPANAKTPVAMLLPIIKIFLRNVMSRTVVHLKDEIPEVVLMNVEVFNSLFMSYCMQNTPSIWTTLGLIAIDGAQMMASLHDVGVVIQHLGKLEALVNSERSRQGFSHTMRTQAKEFDSKSILVYTEEILDRYQSMSTNEIGVASVENATAETSKVVQLNVNAKGKSSKGVPKHIVYSPRTQVRPKLKATPSLRKIFASTEGGGRMDISELEQEYAENVRKALYITEFMLLINYVEVIVPIIFSANLVVMYHLPNRVYYSQINSMDDEKLRQTLGNVMLYCFLQVVSLVVLFVVLWQKLRVSGLRQLAFVLEKQGEQVQTKLVLWVFYNVQATLEHFASDYTFKFAWLHSTPA
ncbi:hypothetical protein PF010_g23117 [Phytophthora fragariae]|uniref:Uncharacterized protein n=1 Tax=Phytophthora fragariae TaxID=53985 RepID=A0A6G0K7E4_9STRA|nr:hypothetical protein PF010_g23117 [Phytophthora fragariae]